MGGYVCLGQRTTLSALGEAQDVFRQPVCRFHVSLATIDQHAAQATFKHQFHLFGDHRRVVNFQRRQQFMGKIMGCLFC